MTSVDRLRGELAAKLIDLSRNNPLLYYRGFKLSRLDLPSPDSDAMTSLYAGETLVRAQLAASPAAAVPVPLKPAAPAALDAPAPPRPIADLLTLRLTAIRRKARENEEERGLRTLFAGLGMISWRASDGGRDPLALALLLPVEIVPDGRVRGELALRRFEGAEATLNPALLEALPPEISARLRAVALDPGLDDVAAALAAVRAVVATLPELEYHERAALGNFSFQLMSMVEDLNEAGDLLASHSLVRALAGDEAARTELQAERDVRVELGDLDAIPPARELFVLDADPWQAQAIHTLGLPGAGHAIVDGPPGTGKSQTIANLIGSLVSAGKTVLFVAEKRAALDVVRKRLTDAGLGSLVLDLHGSDITRKQTYAQLRTSMTALRAAPPAHFASDDDAFERGRTRLNDHCDFQNAPLPLAERSPYAIFGRLESLRAAPRVAARWSGAALARLTPAVLADSCLLVAEAAKRTLDLAPDAARTWATATFATDADATSAVASVRALRDDGLGPVLGAVASVFAERPATVNEAIAAASDLATLGELGATFRPDAFALDDATLEAAIAAHASPFAVLTRLFDGRQSAARAAIVRSLVVPGADRAIVLAALRRLRAVGSARRAGAARTPPPDPVALRHAIEVLAECFAALTAALGGAPHGDLATLAPQLEALLRDARAPYVAARLRAIEGLLAARELGPCYAELRALAPDATAPSATAWPQALERAWLESHLDVVRGRIATFDGREHDGVVTEFAGRDRARFAAAGRRVLRAAAERFVAVTREFPKEQVEIDVQLARQRKLRPVRELFETAPHVLTAVAPCVMASPLSVSQFLPRAQLFDFVVFDEGSQVAPENAVTAIVRGRRVVVAGDRQQLPPTAFFTAVSDSDEESDDDDPSALEGMQSLLDAIKAFAKPLTLRVHYRSRDEKLIAFSNHHMYDDRLVTFPGTGRDGRAVSYERVPAGASEIDETSSAAEVSAVVARVIEHAERRPHESLGVIAMSIKHAQRIALELDRVRRDRPDLDAFFAEHRAEPFFVKNLERVQGDERDAIVLSIGYGRTKTGAVSHNFGPVNVAGGERRLNVAITRAKNRVLLISQLRSSDLDPKRLTSRGAKLLAAYLRYAESGGDDLGRDRPHDEIAPDEFEADVKSALEAAHGWSIVSQMGAGEFRIDLAVRHPARPGTYVLAIECDGASYHSAPTARLRDRLRQQILEARGWQFLRIWSTDWFNDRASEIARAGTAFQAALARADAEEAAAALPAEPAPLAEPPLAAAPAPAPEPEPEPFARPGPSPIVRRYASIEAVPMATLVELVRWILSDERIRTDDELVREATKALGFARRGKAIVARLTAAMEEARSEPIS